MPNYRLNIVFTGIDFDDDAVFEALSDLPNLLWRTQGKFAFVSAVLESTSVMKAVDEVTRLVTDRVPNALPFKLDEDLVSIPDIAGRIGVTREAVRNWANGSRHSNFPFPRGVVGDNIKVWSWAEISTWLNENLALGDPELFPSSHDVALVNAIFASQATPHAAVELLQWNATESLLSRPQQTRLAVSTLKPTPLPQRQHAVKLRVLDGALSGAA